MADLTPELAARLARIALGHVTREFPFAQVHVVTGPGDVATPRSHHPIFFGSFDWHSCVHSHWLLAAILRLYPHLSESAAIRAHFSQAFTKEKVAGELAYLNRTTSAGFERPYGWAWTLKLAAELGAHAGADGRAWSDALHPLAASMASRFQGFLPKADYPVRAGVHSNSAFALILAHDYAEASRETELRSLIGRKARAWFLDDTACQVWEPSGDDFLSPALVEAGLMRRILSRAEFLDWFAAFLPEAAEGRPPTLFTPAKVSDRSDAKIAHLDGLNLSRAWCWRGLASAFADESPTRARALDTAARHLEAALPHLSADYMGEHWLASFALLALNDA